MSHSNGSASGPSPTHEKSESAAGSPVRGPSSSVLYTLLQDLGLTATAQALCEELQRQHIPIVSALATREASSEGAAVARSVTSATAGVAASAATAIGVPDSTSPRVQPTAPDTASGQLPSSLEPTTNAAAQSQSVVPVTTPTAVSGEKTPSPLTDAARLDAEAEAACNDLFKSSIVGEGCRAAIETLAACAGELLSGASSKSDTSTSTTSVSDLEAALLMLWTQEARSVNAARADDFYVVSLIARAAWSELRITEDVFLQEYCLIQSTSHAGAAVLHAAQRALVDYALQLIATLQELLSITEATNAAADTGEHNATVTEASLGSCIMSHLHSRAVVWLRNAECVMAWVLRRQTCFDAPSQTCNAEQVHHQPPPPPSQQRKRRCLEHSATQDCTHAPVDRNGGVLPPSSLQTLQSSILSIATAAPRGGAPISEAYPPRSAAQLKSECSNAALHAAVCVPTSVRLAMTVQRVKLLLALSTALTYNGDRSIVCTVAEAAAAAAASTEGVNGHPASQNTPAEVLHRWWTWRCVMQAQLLHRTARQLRLHLSSNGAVSTTALKTTAATAASQPWGEVSAENVRALVALLDTQARQLLLSPNSLDVVVRDVSSSGLSTQQLHSSLSLSVALLGSLEREQDERATWLDRFVLDHATAAAASVHLPRSICTVTPNTQSGGGGISHSPNISRDSPSTHSEGSSVDLPVWTLPLPALPPLPTSAVVTSANTAEQPATATTVRAAAQVLRWQPHFTHLLTTIATGRWQAPADAPAVAHPCSHYNHTRLHLMRALSHAQELVRLQPRRLVAANGCEYVPRPGEEPSPETSLSLVEQMPRVMQLFTLQSTRVVQRTQRRLTAQTRTLDDTAVGTSSAQGQSASKRTGEASLQRQRRHCSSSVLPQREYGAFTASTVGATTPSVWRRLAAGVHEAWSNDCDAAATCPGVGTKQESPVHHTSARSSNPSTAAGVSPEAPPERAAWPPESAAAEAAESFDPLREPSPSPSSSSTLSPPVSSSESEEQSSSSEVASRDEAEEEEDEEEEEEGDDTRSVASSADADYERVEDAMKEEVECVEVTQDGRLLALLTARGRLTVLRLQARDSVQHYEEEILLDAVLPRVPQKRLQWYESLSSFIHFSPCHRFLLASVQFLAIREKGRNGPLARRQHDNAGEICVYSLHCTMEEEDGDNGASTGGQARPHGQSTTAPSSFATRMQQLLYPLPDRMYECFCPHSAPCLSARWVDPRWWGGGRRSRWANSATEPLNTATATAAVVMRGAESGGGDGGSVQRRQSVQEMLLPASWRVAAAVLLSEYQCLSIGLDDRIVRWMPASGIVLQCIVTEPVHDLVVSPLMAAFYVMSDAGELYMYDVWDERDVGVETTSSDDGDGGGCVSIWSNPGDACEHEAHPLTLPVTEDGHPRYYRTGIFTQPYGAATSSSSAAAALLSAVRGLDAEESDNNVNDVVHTIRHPVHFTGPVTPVFQRMIDPIEKRRQRTQTTNDGIPHHHADSRRPEAENDGSNDSASTHHGRGVSGEDGGTRRCSRLPRSLRWLLPRRWTPHTPWDAQLGRRLIRHLLRRSGAPTNAGEGQLCYERENEGDDDGTPMRGSHARVTRISSSDGNGDAAEEGEGGGEAGSQNHSIIAAEVDDEAEEDDEEEQTWEYDYTNSALHDDDGVRPPHLSHTSLHGTHHSNDVVSAAAVAAAAARDAAVAMQECATHPTPARGTLRRAYYPSGSCLVYRNVVQALRVAGDLADRQHHDDLGPGGATHHLLSFALSGAPQWRPEQRLGNHDENSGEAAHAGTDSPAPPSPPTRWSAAALARVILWKNRLSTLRFVHHITLETWARWEAQVLATTYHADVVTTPTAGPARVGAAAATTTTLQKPTWSASQLLANRGFQRARDVWSRGSPAAQRGLAATARNGRYLCIMTTVGPYRKLVNPREPLCDVRGFYACVVFDVYAGAVLRVIPVCPVDPTGLRGLSMLTSPQHAMDVKMPLYRLECSVAIVPVVAATALTESAKDAGPAIEDEDEDEAAEPKEIVVLTIGGLANTIYVFDALSGRRIACACDVEHQCALSAAAAYRASQATRTTSTACTNAVSVTDAVAGGGDTSAAPCQLIAPQAHSSAAVSPSFPSPSSSLLPSSIRKPADVLVSVATWGRGSGFDGITGRSSPSSSLSASSDAERYHARNGGSTFAELGAAASPSSPSYSSSPQQQRQASEPRNGYCSSRVEAAQHTLQRALLRTGEEPMPRLLQDCAAASDEVVRWDLYEILGMYHRQQRTTSTPHNSFRTMGGEGGVADGESRSDSEWEAETGAEVWEWHDARQPSMVWKNNGSSDKTNDVASRASPLYSFYQTLLGGTAATLKADNANEQRSTAVVTPSHGAEWRQQRRRLIERLLRHYDVDLVWQAYVALFATSTTGADALAPQSAVATLVDVALRTAKCTAGADADVDSGVSRSGSPDAARLWVWCGSCRHPCNASPVTAMPAALEPQLEPPRCNPDILQKDAVSRCTISVAQPVNENTTNNDVEGVKRSEIPFASILQQREDFVWELREVEDTHQLAPVASTTRSGSVRSSPSRSPSRPATSSLLEQMHIQAMRDGSLSPNAKLLHAQQRDAAAAASETSALRSTKRFLPSHHQNQLRLDVVNAVATWVDHNGGFYVCLGSEDGGLYMLGGNVAD
jgi:hypothetical protein